MNNNQFEFELVEPNGFSNIVKAYEERKAEKSIPNGIFSETSYNYNDEVDIKIF